MNETKSDATRPDRANERVFLTSGGLVDLASRLASPPPRAAMGVRHHRRPAFPLRPSFAQCSDRAYPVADGCGSDIAGHEYSKMAECRGKLGDRRITCSPLLLYSGAPGVCGHGSIFCRCLGLWYVQRHRATDLPRGYGKIL